MVSFITLMSLNVERLLGFRERKVNTKITNINYKVKTREMLPCSFKKV